MTFLESAPPFIVSVLFFMIGCGVYARARGTPRVFSRWLHAILASALLVGYIVGIAWLAHGVVDAAHVFTVLSLVWLAGVGILFATVAIALVTLVLACAVIVPLVLLCRWQRVLDLIVPFTAAIVGVISVLCASVLWMGYATKGVMVAAQVSAMTAFIVTLVPVLVGAIALRIKWVLARPA